jgi:hypothetical protein
LPSLPISGRRCTFWLQIPCKNSRADPARNFPSVLQPACVSGISVGRLLRSISKGLLSVCSFKRPLHLVACSKGSGLQSARKRPSWRNPQIL